MKRTSVLIILSFLLFSFSINSFAINLNNVRTTPLNGTVALTFDDGPNPKTTIQILNILKKYNVKATFFVMGPLAKKYPGIIQQILTQGHAVASHTMTHKKLTKMNSKQLYYEIVKSKQLIKKASGGLQPVCVRPPYGMGNKRVGNYIRSKGMIMVPMGFNSFDYKNRGSKWLANWVIKNARNKRVFLLHDGYHERPQTVEALPTIIKGIKKKGLKFSAICYGVKS